jgi:hypothetical protein
MGLADLDKRTRNELTPMIFLIVLCAVVLFYMAVRCRRRQAVQSLRPVNLKAFRALMDRNDELFLRGKLPRSKFFRLKRHRIRVTLRYVVRIAANASVVLRMSEATRLSSAPEVADAAAQVMMLARQIRLQCLLAMGKLVAEYAIPNTRLHLIKS